MAPCCVVHEPAPELKHHLLFEKFIYLHYVLLKRGHQIPELRKIIKNGNVKEGKTGIFSLKTIIVFFSLFLLYYSIPHLSGLYKYALGVKCLVPNTYFVWEATRPVANCKICRNVQVTYLENATRESFAPYAYSYRPIVVRGAALDWPATRVFNYDFFKRLFAKVEGSYESVEEECQFLRFKTEFHSLQDVFSMEEDRVHNSSSPWYIGWYDPLVYFAISNFFYRSNCHRDVLKSMRKYYKKPHFLPKDAEHSHVDFIFMGYQQGAYMHLDYISRLMWQAQLQGHKTWRLSPPPECEDVCKNLTFTVNPGDILLLDTRQWYHDTSVKDKEFSLTVSSEYG